MDKRSLSKRDICTKFITPALRKAGWDEMLQIREEVGFTEGRIIVRGKLVSRGQAKRADYVLYYKPNIPLALIEAKDNTHSVGDGMQQGLDYAATLDIPFVLRIGRTRGVFCRNQKYGLEVSLVGKRSEKESGTWAGEYPAGKGFENAQPIGRYGKAGNQWGRDVSSRGWFSVR